MKYNIQILDRSFPKSNLVQVFDGRTGIRRNAEFSTLADAEEAARIISMLRMDSAFEGTKIIVNTELTAFRS